MPTDTLRMTVGFLIIGSHITSFAMILLGGSFTGDERTELSLIIAPVFSVYVTAIVRRLLALTEFDRTPLHPAVAVLGIAIAVVFSIAIPAVVWSFESGRIENFAGLKSTIGIVETALGIYTGALIERLFGTADNNAPNQADGAAK